MSAANDVETAIACMKAGAVDYIVKPMEGDRLISTIRKTIEIHNLRGELTSLKEYLLSDVLKHEDVFSNIITRSKKMRSIFQYLEAVAPTPHTVMITGETGVGKDLVAQAVHRLSGRKGDFIVVNVAGLDDTMFSDTLFGHKKGAFTGAEQTRRGLIARAENGTLFLDEIGDLSPSSQVKLLRLVNGEKIRKDLYYRLCSHRVHIPPLRERPEDIPALLDHFIGTAASSLKKEKPVLHPGLAEFLSKYDFPGNVRELKAMVYDAVARHKSGTLTMGGFKEITAQKGYTGEASGTLLNIFGHFPTFDEAENYLIDEAMKLAGGNQSLAASFLGITRQALNRRVKKKS
jgi:DNA-binding NtrC family response regulator